MLELHLRHLSRVRNQEVHERRVAQLTALVVDHALVEGAADTLVVCGVRFMGETAKTLNPEKRVLMPDLAATCSLDEGCPADEFSAFCDAHPDHTVVVYANTSAEVKARADWMVTSGIALPIVQHLHERGEKILWAPDKHLSHYVQQQTGADMLFWDGSCVVHEEFKGFALQRLKLLPDPGEIGLPVLQRGDQEAVVGPGLFQRRGQGVDIGLAQLQGRDRLGPLATGRLQLCA